MVEYNPFDAPIPGQSLTTTPGAFPFEKPAQFSNPEDAAEYVWDKLTSPKEVIKVLAALKAGVPAEFIARTIIFAGFMSGKWTPDVALIIGKPVLYMIVKIAQVKGLTKINLWNPDKEQDNIMKEFSAMLDKEKAEPQEAPKDIIEDIEEEEEEEKPVIGMLG